MLLPLQGCKIQLLYFYFVCLASVRNLLMVNSVMEIDFYFPNLIFCKEGFQDGIKGGIEMSPNLEITVLDPLV